MRKNDSGYEFVSREDPLFKKEKLNRNANAESNNAKEPPLLSCKEISKSYGSKTAISGVSLEVSRGKIIGLLGPNGSGKTTIIKLIAGLLTLDSGEIKVLGEKIGVKTKALVSYLPERNSLPLYLTVAEAISFFEDFFADFDREMAERIISDLSIDKKHKIKALSKGDREKINLALVMARRAALYILDEPISGVDPAARDYIIDTVLKNVPEGSSVIISTHLISDIERIMDEFVFMKYGQIYTVGTPADIKGKYGMSVDVYFREVFRC